jgi:ubiquinone/menaquinone biosynthesis C-methylase UbiE
MDDRSITEPERRESARWSGADSYERYMGRWSREAAREFLAWLDPSPGLRWLDLGCGTGALTSEILAREKSAPSELWGIDPSAAFVEYARASIRDPRARFETGPAEELPFEGGRFDVVVSGLVLNFVAEPASAVEEMSRVAAPTGVVASYVGTTPARCSRFDTSGTPSSRSSRRPLSSTKCSASRSASRSL